MIVRVKPLGAGGEGGGVGGGGGGGGVGGTSHSATIQSWRGGSGIVVQLGNPQ